MRRWEPGKNLGEQGATILENLIACTLLVGAALAILPVFSYVKKYSKSGDSMQLCQNIVRGKLDEYRFGRQTSLENAATATGDYAGLGLPAKPEMRNLSVLTLSSSSVTNLASPTPITNLGGGFFYSKVRYNRFFPASCLGLPNIVGGPTILAPVTSAPTLGMRECVGSNAAWDDSAVFACNNPVDTRVRGELPGFKLYVKLELSTSWEVNPTTTTASADQKWQYSSSCPNDGSWPGAVSNPATAAEALYDFAGAGDGIRVTVTGVIDILSVSNGATQFGEIPVTSPARLMCSVQSEIRPAPEAVRYYLSKDGRIYSIHGHGINGREDNTPDPNGITDPMAMKNWAYRSLYQDSLGNPAFSGIRSIAVHPRGISIYVLRAGGSLTRYSNCGSVPTDCNPDPDDAGGGVSDSGPGAAPPWPAALSTTPPVQEWRIPASIASVAVNWRSGRVYGISGDRQQFFEIFNSDGTYLKDCVAGNCLPTDIEDARVAALAGTSWLPTTPLATRLVGFFIDPEDNGGFVSDLASSATLGATTYNSTIYRIQDTALTNPIVTLPVDAVAFSM